MTDAAPASPADGLGAVDPEVEPLLARLVANDPTVDLVDAHNTITDAVSAANVELSRVKAADHRWRTAYRPSNVFQAGLADLEDVRTRLLELQRRLYRAGRRIKADLEQEARAAR